MLTVSAAGHVAVSTPARAVSLMGSTAQLAGRWKQEPENHGLVFCFKKNNNFFKGMISRMLVREQKN